MMPIALRAIRFGWHLAVHYPKHLLDELCSISGSIICYPLWLLGHWPVRQPTITIKTEHPVATLSPDHLHPHGTAKDTRRSFSFVFGNFVNFGRGAYLDLGCAHGDVVADMYATGWQAVGIEGSDYNKIHKRRAWLDYGGVLLFTADLGKPLQILADGKPYLADLVTAWCVAEHIPPPEIPQFLVNAKNHLARNGLFVLVTSNNSDKPDGIELHQTQWTRRQWLEAFRTAGFRETCSPYPRWAMYRNSVDGLEFFLKHIEVPTKTP